MNWVHESTQSLHDCLGQPVVTITIRNGRHKVKSFVTDQRNVFEDIRDAERFAKRIYKTWREQEV